MSPSEAMAAHGLTVRAEFVPFSHSRNAKANAHPKDMSLNWKVTLVKHDRAILTTDYSAGIAHCPSYKQNARWTLEYDKAIRGECETGKRETGKRGAPILPKPEDVLYSLLIDSDGIDYSSFEDWANSFGYDPDSRKAESIYRACLEIGLRLRNGLGAAALDDLRDAFQDY